MSTRRHICVAFDHYVPRAPDTFWKAVLKQWSSGMKRKVPEATLVVERCGQDVHRAFRAVTALCIYNVSNGRTREELVDSLVTPVFEPVIRWSQMAPQEAIGTIGILYEGQDRERPASCAAVLRGMLGHEFLRVQRSPLGMIVDRFPSENQWLEELFDACMKPDPDSSAPVLVDDREPTGEERQRWHAFLRKHGPKIFDHVWGDPRWPKAQPEVIQFAEQRRRRLLTLRQH